MTADRDDDPPSISTDLSPAERRIVLLRLAHAQHGHFYDERSMRAELDSLRVRWPADKASPDIGSYAISERAKAELRVNLDALDAGISEGQRDYTRRIRELTGLTP